MIMTSKESLKRLSTIASMYCDECATDEEELETEIDD